MEFIKLFMVYKFIWIIFWRFYGDNVKMTKITKQDYPILMGSKDKKMIR